LAPPFDAPEAAVSALLDDAAEDAPSAAAFFASDLIVLT
jgi:hypothetical protein